MFGIWCTVDGPMGHREAWLKDVDGSITRYDELEQAQKDAKDLELKQAKNIHATFKYQACVLAAKPTQTVKELMDKMHATMIKLGKEYWELTTATPPQDEPGLFDYKPEHLAAMNLCQYFAHAADVIPCGDALQTDCLRDSIGLLNLAIYDFQK